MTKDEDSMKKSRCDVCGNEITEQSGKIYNGHIFVLNWGDLPFVNVKLYAETEEDMKLCYECAARIFDNIRLELLARSRKEDSSK